MNIQKLVEKHVWKILILWIVIISSLAFVFGCTPASTVKVTEKHVVVDITRDYHDNSIHPIEPLYKVTLDDSTTIRSTKKYHVGDTITYVMYSFKK